jgi:hypothetical protein
LRRRQAGHIAGGAYLPRFRMRSPFDHIVLAARGMPVLRLGTRRKLAKLALAILTTLCLLTGASAQSIDPDHPAPEATKAAADGKVDTSIRKDGVQVMEEAMLYFFALAEQERRRGDKGDRRQICENYKIAAEIGKDLAQYHRPKITAIRMGGDPNLPPISLETLNDAQLDLLIQRLLAGTLGKGPDPAASGAGPPFGPGQVAGGG